VLRRAGGAGLVEVGDRWLDGSRFRYGLANMSQRPQASKVFLVEGENGFHLRPISLIVELATKFDSDIKIRKDDVSVGAKSVMELLLLGAQRGDRLEVTAVGVDCAEALHAIEQLFSQLAND